VALGSINDEHGWDASMPSFMHLDPLVNLVDQATLTPEKLETLAAIEGYKQRVNRLAGWINTTHFASIDIVAEQYRAIVLRRYRAALARFNALPSNPSPTSLVRVTPRAAASAPEGEALFEEIARQWMTASSLMYDMLAARHVPYVHVLQPNQYATSRPFGPGEEKVALNPASPFKPGAEHGYPVLVSAAAAGRRDPRTRVFDATYLFDREPAPVYIDDCCHYTLRGYELLADFIASAVRESPGSWRAPGAAASPDTRP